MSVLFCDSNSELWYDKLEELGFNVISMPYTIAGVEYYYDNGKTTDFKAFYDLVRAGEMPITSALNQTNYYEIFEPYFKKGEEILYISFSSELSGTFQFLDQAIAELTEKYPKAKYKKFDTKSISMGAGLQVYLAGKYFKAGHSLDETYSYLESITNSIRTLFIVEDLNHLKRGGRLNSTSAFLGSLMSVKPILQISAEGKLVAHGKVKGMKKAVRAIVEDLLENYNPLDDCPICIVNADNIQDAELIESLIREGLNDVEIITQQVGPTIGSHCGPGTCGLIFPAKSR